MYYETSTALYRDEFESRKTYLDAYHDFCRHYGFKARVTGGWMFFAFATDYNTWRNQC